MVRPRYCSLRFRYDTHYRIKAVVRIEEWVEESIKFAMGIKEETMSKKLLSCALMFIIAPAVYHFTRLPDLG